MRSVLLAFVVLCSLLAIEAKTQLDAETHRRLLLSGRPHVGLWQALLKDAKIKEQEASLFNSNTQQTFHSPKTTFQAHCFEQPISHFSEHINTTFCQRYWIDASSYQPGGPVIVLDGGETNGEYRIPFLEKGILQILSNATNGLAIILEHRYYGDSVPVSSLSTDDLRFLNNEEALEDSAQFIGHFKPPSSVLQLEDDNALHPNNTPWIYYGGSYAGARSAHMRVQYPHLVWGAIASSAVTHAQINFPEYHDVIQKYAPPECISALQSAINTIDTVLDLPEPAPTILKGLFGLEQLSDNTDFASAISSVLGAWQGQNWDPEVGSDLFAQFCTGLTAGGATSKIGIVRIPSEVLNYAAFVKASIVEECPRSDGNPASDIEDCFGSQDDEKFRDTDVSQSWRLWMFQVCIQWGYFMPASLVGPNIISKRLTLDYTSKTCRQAFPPGKHFSIPAQPDVESVNARGDYAIEMDRLAIIDGDRDPWRPMTPGSDMAPQRKSTVNTPVHLIFEGVHHYDENGLSHHSLEPAQIQDVHELEKSFVQEWVAQFHEEKAARQV